MRAVRVVALWVLVVAVIGCGAQMHQRLQTAPPRAVGVVVGHDINAIASLTTGEEILVGLSFGLIGLTVAAATAEKEALSFEAQLRELVAERLLRQLREKGYKAQLVSQKPKKWALFENLSDRPEVYGNLVREHGLDEHEARQFDAILFVEYWIEGRLQGRFLSRPKFEELTVDKMQPKYAKSKLFLYDTRAGTRLYFDSFQRGYPTFTSASVATALETITDLGSLPAVP